MPPSFGPLLDLNLQWNRGISFSFLETNTAVGRIVLLAFTCAAVLFLVSWLVRCKSILVGAGLGGIIGGAVGNAIDRVRHGAVVDFLDLHISDRHLFVFNLADAAINVGVALLILDALLRQGSGSRDSKQ